MAMARLPTGPSPHKRTRRSAASASARPNLVKRVKVSAAPRSAAATRAFEGRTKKPMSLEAR
jgi:hypothetical protein